MRHLSTQLPFTCVTCEVEINGTPEFYVGLPFCCAGCVVGGPCICSYDDVAENAPDGAPARPFIEVISFGSSVETHECADINEQRPLVGAGSR